MQNSGVGLKKKKKKRNNLVQACTEKSGYFQCSCWQELLMSQRNCRCFNWQGINVQAPEILVTVAAHAVAPWTETYCVPKRHVTEFGLSLATKASAVPHSAFFFTYKKQNQHVKWQRWITEQSWVSTLDQGDTKKDSDANKKFDESLLGTSASLFPFDVLVLAWWSKPDGCHNVLIFVGTLCAHFEQQKHACIHVHTHVLCCVCAVLHFHSKVQVISY